MLAFHKASRFMEERVVELKILKVS